MALQVEEAFMAPSAPEAKNLADMKLKTVLNDRDPDQANLKSVLAITESEWTNLGNLLDEDMTKKVRKANTLVGLTVTVNFSHLVDEKKHIAYNWARMRMEFEGPRLQRRFKIQREYVLLNLDQFDGNFNEYSRQLEEKLLLLRALGKNISDLDAVVDLVAGIAPGSLDPVIEVLMNMDEEDIKFSDAVAKIKASYARSGKVHDDSISKIKERKKKDLSKITCYYCKKKGHYANKCHKKKRDKAERKKEGKDKQEKSSEQYKIDDVAWCIFCEEQPGVACLNATPQGKSCNVDVNMVDCTNSRYIDDCFCSFCDSELERSPSQSKMHMGIVLRSETIPQGKLTHTLIDDGASRHCFRDKAYFISFRKESGRGVSFGLAGAKLKCEGTGIVRLDLPGKHFLILKDVGYSPKFSGNVIARELLKRDGYHLSNDEDKGITHISKDLNGERKLLTSTVRLNGGVLKFLKHFSSCNDSVDVRLSSAAELAKNRRSVLRWHITMGHPSFKALKAIKSATLDMDIDFKSSDQDSIICEACDQTKLVRKSFAKKKSYADVVNKSKVHPKALQHLSSDVKGILKSSRDGKRYYLVIIDLATKYLYAKALPSKLIFTAVRDFILSMESKLAKKVSYFTCDLGGEFRGRRLVEWFAKKGVEVRRAPKDHPQLNGAAERSIQTVHRMIKVMLKQAKLTFNLWPLALQVAVFILNRTPHPISSFITPYERMFGSKPSLKYAVPFGCVGFVAIPAQRRTRGGFGDVGAKCRMVGYGSMPGTYKLLLESGRITESKHVKFYQDKFAFPRNDEADTSADIDDVDPSPPTSNVPVSIDAKELKDGKVNVPPPPRRSSRQRQPILRFDPSPKYRSPKDASSDEAESKVIYDTLNVMEEDEPRHYSDAKRSGQWEEAISNELDALTKNKTWNIIKRPPGAKLVGSRWIFKVKRTKTGSIERRKARLVARGFMQTGVPWEDRYAPTVRQSTIRLIISYASRNGMRLTQADINNAYLHGILSPPVLMGIPDGLKNIYDPATHCCELVKGLYGLPVSGNSWNKELDGFMSNLGFKRCLSDPCLYILRKDTGLMLVCVYVDDLVIATSSDALRSWFLKSLSKAYGIKNVGDLDFLLGVRVDKTPTGYHLSQQLYIEKIAKRFNVIHGVSSPLLPSVSISRDKDGIAADEKVYRSLIGSLMYLMVFTRPDLAYSLSKLSRYLASPTKVHLMAARRVLGYALKTKNYSLKFSCDEKSPIMEMWVDADHAGCIDTRRSTSGLLIFVYGSLVQWKSRRQPVPAKSTAEAEYISLAEGISEGLLLKNLLKELDEDPGSVLINEDNQACVRIASNPVITQRSKAIDIKYHYARYHVQAKNFRLQYVESKLQYADALTKALTGPSLSRFCNRVFSVSSSSFTDAKQK
eukprot:CAMPEP_0167749862 /NCGR_PEP_ID=MMETSP0110_2-20121227/5657_1 /TAXON_ID=629695 /ORGANISM="Gymnochlora sp., Strain CCMP2014" /LENGTH=1396 /DNA_ID=CAMNT_0007635091 /DNA_START=3079 /DNA_END=7269 /DNA_ORIENTATION=+